MGGNAPLVDVLLAYLNQLRLLDPLDAADGRARLQNQTAVHYRTMAQFVTIFHRLALLWSGAAAVGGPPSAVIQIPVFDRARDLMARALPAEGVSEATLWAIGRHKALGVRYAYVPCLWQYSKRRRTGIEAAAHATVLLVDTAQRVYTLYNPTSNAVRYRLAVREPPHYVRTSLRDLLVERDHRARTGHAAPFIRGYEYRETPTSLTHDRPLQDAVERAAEDTHSLDPDVRTVSVRGLCASLTTLVVLACRRLDYHDPWAVSRTLMSVLVSHFARPAHPPDAAAAMTPRRAREDFRMRLEHLYRGVFRSPNLAALADLLCVERRGRGGERTVYRPAEPSRCGAFLDHLPPTVYRRFCGRPPMASCAEEEGAVAYCPQHYQRILLARWMVDDDDGGRVPWDALVPRSEFHAETGAHKRPRDDNEA